jgi:hypothetical protein
MKSIPLMAAALNATEEDELKDLSNNIDMNIEYLRDCFVQLRHETVVCTAVFPLLPNVLQREDVAVVDVLESLARKIFCDKLAGSPLFQSGVDLSECQ